MNELTTYEGSGTLDGMMQLANMLSKAQGMIPKHLLGEPGKILAAVLTGRELGVGPMAAMRSFHVVEGKPCADYSFWIAQLKRAGYRVEWRDCSDTSATLILTAPDGTTHEETWNQKRAQVAGLWGRNTWKQYPDAMLKARCVTSAGRSFAAEVMAGCYDISELDEITGDDRADVGPAVDAGAGKTGTARLAARIGAVQPKQIEVADPATPMQLTVADVCSGVTAATTVAEMLAWADQARGLPEKDQPTAREAFARRRGTFEVELARLCADAGFDDEGQDLEFAMESVGIVPKQPVAKLKNDQLGALMDNVRKKIAEHNEPGVNPELPSSL